MKKLLYTLVLVLACLPVSSHALETSLKGFIALDALNFEKISGEKGAAVIGIGVLDLKIFAEQDNMSAAIKLDLDGKLATDFNIFEEAYGTYRGKQNWRLSLGKGVVKFQNLHWGAVENTYLDGGSILGTEQNWRKQSRKNFMAISYGGRSQGFIDQFTFWGDSVEYEYDDNGKLIYLTRSENGKNVISGYKTAQEKAFSTNKQLGFGNKLELFATDAWKFTAGQILYKSEFADDVSWAVDFGGNYETSAMEGWFDVLYGYTNKLPYDSYTTKDKTELFYQFGAEYYLDETWSLVGNTEGVFVKDVQHTYANLSFIDPVSKKTVNTVPSDEQAAKSGQTVKSFQYKVEAAIKYKLTKTSFITTGGLYEKKIADRNDVEDLKSIPNMKYPNREAIKLSSAISFWF
jgi:hypothetical protein